MKKIRSEKFIDRSLEAAFQAYKAHNRKYKAENASRGAKVSEHETMSGEIMPKLLDEGAKDNVFLFGVLVLL